MSPVCTGCHIVCTAEIHTNINLTEATCFCTLRKKRLHVQKLLHMNALSEEEALPLKSLAYFLDSRHTFSISVEDFICWWKSASHPSWVDAEQWVDEMWLTVNSKLRTPYMYPDYQILKTCSLSSCKSLFFCTEFWILAASSGVLQRNNSANTRRQFKLTVLF